MRFPIIQKLIDWFKRFSSQRKILMIAILALLIFCSPWLYHRLTLLYNSKVCSRSGGEWIPVGLAQEWACIYTYPDGGKPCDSSEECAGGCYIYEFPTEGQQMPNVGVCRYNSNPFECFAPIERPETYACSD